MALPKGTGVLPAGQLLHYLLRAEFGVLIGLFLGLSGIEGVLLFGN